SFATGGIDEPMSATSEQTAIHDLVAGDEPLTIEKFADKADAGAADVLQMSEKLGVRMVDLKFTDVPGTWQHMTLSISGLDEDSFSDGLGFDGSSIRGFQQISESDMLLMPDPVTAKIDPFYSERPRSQEGYFPVPPQDTLGNLRSLMVMTLEALGAPCEFHHHEVGGPGQGEIDLRFSPLLHMADTLMMHKYIVKNVARAAGKSATFLPKPIFEENGSGMHVHQSLWKGGNTLMFDENGYALLSELALSYVAGLLEHGRALMAF